MCSHIRSPNAPCRMAFLKQHELPTILAGSPSSLMGQMRMLGKVPASHPMAEVMLRLALALHAP